MDSELSPFLGQLALFPYGFVPRGWELCDGRRMLISENTALYVLLRTTYGGDGHRYFCLPDLRGGVIVGVGPGLDRGSAGGEHGHALSQAEMPSHTHTLMATDAKATAANPGGNVFAKTLAYGTEDPVPMDPSSVSSVGKGLPHENCQPYLVLSYCIAVEGIFPNRH